MLTKPFYLWGVKILPGLLGAAVQMLIPAFDKLVNILSIGGAQFGLSQHGDR